MHGNEPHEGGHQTFEEPDAVAFACASASPGDSEQQMQQLEVELDTAKDLVDLLQAELTALVNLEFDTFHNLVSRRKRLLEEIVAERKRLGPLRRPGTPEIEGRLGQLELLYSKAEECAQHNLKVLYHGLSTIREIAAMAGQRDVDPGCYDESGQLASPMVRLFSKRG